MSGSAQITPQVVLDLANSLIRDTDDIDRLAQSMPGKIQQMEEGARGLDAVVTTSDNFEQAMRALQQLAANLDQERQHLNDLANRMEALIHSR